MVGKGSTGAAAVVRVERSEDAYEVVLEDGDELVLAHYDADDWDGAEADAERWAAGLTGPRYAIDDETAIQVVDGTITVISEGHWKRFTP